MQPFYTGCTVMYALLSSVKGQPVQQGRRAACLCFQVSTEQKVRLLKLRHEVPNGTLVTPCKKALVWNALVAFGLSNMLLDAESRCLNSS